MKWNKSVLTLAVLALTCKESPPEPPLWVPSVTLRVEDVGVTEAWLRVGVLMGASSRSVEISRNGQVIRSLTLTTSDSAIIADSLLPKQTYTFTACRTSGGKCLDTASVQLTTMDTTSHNFTWQIDTLGDGAWSVLYDVAVISDTLIYAVGDLYLRDSTGQFDPIRYNAAIWNGTRWRILRIPYYTPGPFYGEIRWVFALSEKDIWFGNSVHWDGQQFHNVDIGTSIFLGIGSTRMWASPDGQLYVVGNSGTIAYSPDHGSTWQQLPSRTALPINDIWGGVDPTSGGIDAICVASNTFLNQGMQLLRIQGNLISRVTDSGLNWSLAGVWFVRNRFYIVVGGGLYVKHSLQEPGPWTNMQSGLTQYYMTKVRGTGLNDVIVVGAFGNLLHFNGATWRNLQAETSLSNGGFAGLAVKGSFLVAVGYNGARAVALRGYRQ